MRVWIVEGLSVNGIWRPFGCVFVSIDDADEFVSLLGLGSDMFRISEYRRTEPEVRK